MYTSLFKNSGGLLQQFGEKFLPFESLYCPKVVVFSAEL